MTKLTELAAGEGESSSPSGGTPTLTSGVPSLDMREYRFYVHIVGSLSRTLYTGMCNNLKRRVWEHKQHEIEGFTSKYQCDRLLYWESFDDVRNAINREKQIKRWRREKKVFLIEKLNPQWKDLARQWYEEGRGPSTRPLEDSGSRSG